MTYEEKVEEAKKQRIYLPEELLREKIVGVYGFFAINKKDKKKKCFYIGKSTDMADRLLGSSDGHVHYYLHGYFNGLVPALIKKYLDSNHDIKVEILAKVDYKDEFFSKAAHRLALAEIEKIVEYQKQDQCLVEDLLEQPLEGIGKKEKAYWEKNYKIGAVKSN